MPTDYIDADGTVGEKTMPGGDKECEGPGATHHFACKCREAVFSKLKELVEDLSLPDKMSETSGTLLRRFNDLRERARALSSHSKNICF